MEVYVSVSITGLRVIEEFVESAAGNTDDDR